MIHECFHLFSKNHPEERFKLYDRIHYRSTGAAVLLPDVPWGPPGSQSTIADLKITNPDEPDFDVYIEMLVPSIPGDEDNPRVKRALAPLLLANRPYEGGVFFEYLEWWFMSIAEGPDRRPDARRSDSVVIYYQNLHVPPGGSPMLVMPFMNI